MAQPAQSTIVWLQSEPYGMIAGFDRAHVRAQGKMWMGPSVEVMSDLRSFFFSVLVSAANAGSTPVTYDASTQTIVILTSASPYERNNDASTALLNGLIALIARKSVTIAQLDALSKNKKKYRVTTVSGGPAETVDVSAPFVVAGAAAVYIAAGVVLSSGIVAAALVWLNGQNNEKQLAIVQTEAKVQEHAKVLDTSREIVESHLERESREQRSIPWTQEELNYIEFLKESSRSLTEWKAPPLKGVVDLQALSQAASGAIADVGSGVKTGIETASVLLPLAAVAIVGIYLMKGKLTW